VKINTLMAAIAGEINVMTAMTMRKTTIWEHRHRTHMLHGIGLLLMCFLNLS
jgi:hypothetical protein